jgi:hypothetical protein
MHQITEFSDTLIYDQHTQGRQIPLGQLWKDTPVLLLFLRRLGCPICRNYAQRIQTVKSTLESRGIQVVAMSFERLGEVSDSDGSFSKGAYWTGSLYQIDKQVYTALFGKISIYDLHDIDIQVLVDIRKNGVTGNFKGDGLTLGGQILVAPPNRVVLDHRQTRFGEDATLEEIYNAMYQLTA